MFKVVFFCVEAMRLTQAPLDFLRAYNKGTHLHNVYFQVASLDRATTQYFYSADKTRLQAFVTLNSNYFPVGFTRSLLLFKAIRFYINPHFTNERNEAIWIFKQFIMKDLFTAGEFRFKRPAIYWRSIKLVIFTSLIAKSLLM